MSGAATIKILGHKLLEAVSFPYSLKCRLRLKNKNFSILCSNCIGGIIYHRLKMEFLSPTINLWLTQTDFVKMIKKPLSYMDCDLQFVPSEYNFPVAKLGDIKIMFNHAKTEEEAQNAWYKRKDRIHYDNLYIILYDRDGLTEDDLRKLSEIPCKRLVVLSEKSYPDIPFVKTIQESKRNKPNKDSFLDYGITGIRTFEKQFDFVAWLNGAKYY